MKIISMVPSWTETLILCGVDVVGRTRFCIHPEDKIKSIPVVGGTKDVDWEKVKSLQADFLLLDKEENPLSMAQESPLPYIATHMKSFSDGPEQCVLLSKNFRNLNLSYLAERWNFLAKRTCHYHLSNLPGIVEWVNPLKPTVTNFIYVIWHNPWMGVSKNTYIGSVLSLLGLNLLGDGEKQLDFDKPYPEFKLEDYDPKTTALLCSSEPFPFHKKKELLKQLPHSVAIVNGEAFSWFGVRSVKFVEAAVSADGRG